MTENAKAPRLAGNRFMQADYQIGRYATTVPAETTIEDVLHPQFFSGQLHVLKPGTLVTVLSDDMVLDCDLRVVSVTKTSVKMRVIRSYDDSNAIQAPKAAVERPKVNHGGPKHQWRFLHNGEVIEHGFASQIEAQKAADAYYERLKGQ